MNRETIVVGSVSIVIGFLLGYFVALGFQSEPLGSSMSGNSSSDLPENHPSPDVMEKLQALIDQAQANPEDREVRVALGNMFYDMNRYDAAIPWYEEAIKLGPLDVHVSPDPGSADLYQGKQSNPK